MHPTLHMLEKELIEHKIVTRLPLFVVLCGVLLFVSLITSNTAQHSFFFEMNVTGDVSDIHMDFARDLNMVITFGAGVIALLLTTLYIPKTLRKERQEGSSMFWRSMPVSNTTTHLVKLGFGLVAIPAICALLVLSADLLLWALNMTNDKQLALLVHQESLFYVLTNWIVFFARMLVVGIALLPLAAITLAISQLVSSPILVILVSGYAIKWLTIGLFGFYGISEFFSEILSLPLNLLLASNLLNVFANVHILSLVIYIALGVVGFIASRKLYQTDDVSLKSLFNR
ncbi:hypothetical protein ACFFUS_13225 [Vibrio gallaecicus]|uniref:hypothetical protein n=1 Tax=Vibrio gallaecicus TaxID=552386 RepID=UPI0010C976F3|nr:hypothetical protein [Vibrio gallaecicus]MDN3615955.1 hypothetical protein [Vibrio gallaecicus]